MVKQVEIGKKGFLNLLKTRKNTVRGLLKLWRIVEEQGRCF
jgi:hypothetical protein